ncbi:hypothetical protein GEA64_03845 [Photorhabdus khanii]|uniref:Uncharacterized protein n=1 Tax=Photorhabdus khanii TaxID=1004150 RepID=A0A7C9GI51_9GAMM|nr:hypothetical protein [Photorhabdus khanii]
MLFQFLPVNLHPGATVALFVGIRHFPQETFTTAFLVLIIQLIAPPVAFDFVRSDVGVLVALIALVHCYQFSDTNRTFFSVFIQ